MRASRARRVSAALGWAAALCLAAPAARAGEETIGAIFLNEGTGARAEAMGQAYVAVCDDVNAVYWNPGALVRFPRSELMVAHTEYLQGFRDEYFAFGVPVTLQDALGLNVFFSYLNSLDKFDIAGNPAGSFSAYDSFASMAWSHAWSKQYAAGISLKGIYQVVDTYSAWSFAADAGFLASDLILPGMTLGLSVKNLGKPIRLLSQSHPLPMTAEAGVACRLWDNRLLVTFDVLKPFQQEMEFKAGAEFSIEDLIFLRAGYHYLQFGNDLGPLSGLAVGLGADISDYKVDYAFTPQADLGNVHRISITFPFGRSLIEEEKTIKRLEKQIKAKQEDVIRNYIATGDQYLRKGDYKSAIEYYEKTLALNSAYPSLKEKLETAKRKQQMSVASGFYQQGLKAYQTKDYITALIEWNKVLDTLPTFPEIKVWLKRVNEKITVEKDAQASAKGDARVKQFFATGLGYLESGQYRLAIEAWKKALDLDPRNSQVQRYISMARDKMQQDIGDMLERADAQWGAGEMIGAVKLWRQVLRIDDQNPAAVKKLEAYRTQLAAGANEMYLKGVENYVQNRLDDAIANWKDVLVLDPDHAKAAKHLKHAQEKVVEIDTLQ